MVQVPANQAQLQAVHQHFQRRRLITFIVVSAILLTTLIAAQALEFRFITLITSFIAAMVWMVENFIPNQAALSHSTEIWLAMLSTVGAAITATLLSAGLALFLAILGATPTAPNRVLSYVIRSFASIMRNIPIVVWAIILLFSFKQNDMTGIVALSAFAVGYLTRAFMETIESNASDTIEALQATGASYWPIVFQGVIPATESLMMSAVLYVIENNVRNATLVGILTGTGIGSVYDLFFKQFNYPAAGYTLMVVVIFVIVLEIVSNNVRRAIL
jgi:phosphonate transport system permease protein